MAHGAKMLIVVALTGCGAFVACGTEVRDVSGAWSGNDPHTMLTASEVVQLVLQQNGGILVGKACLVEDGFLVFSGAPVTGSYPDVAFTVQASNVQPCCTGFAGTSFHGSFNGPGNALNGSFGGSSNPDDQYTLTRASEGSCQGARTVP